MKRIGQTGHVLEIVRSEVDWERMLRIIAEIRVWALVYVPEMEMRITDGYGHGGLSLTGGMGPSYSEQER